MPRHSVFVLSAAGLVVLTAVLTHLASERRAAEQEQLQAQKIAHLAMQAKTLRGNLTRLKQVVRELEAALAEAGRHEEQDQGGTAAQPEEDESSENPDPSASQPAGWLGPPSLIRPRPAP